MSCAQFIHESVREYLLDGGLSLLDYSLSENWKAISHYKLATWCQECIERHPPSSSRGSPCYRFSSRKQNFEKRTLEDFYEHCEMAYRGGALQLEFLDALSSTTQSRIWHWADSHKCYSGTLVDVLVRGGNIKLVEGLLRRRLGRSSNAGGAGADARDGVSTDSFQTTIPYFDVNARRRADCISTLLSATRRGYKDVVELLLDCGADPNMVIPDDSPLLSALHQRDNTIVDLLLHHGADPDLACLRRGEMITPLDMAIARSERYVKVLLECGVDANGCGTSFGSPLTAAVSHDLQETVHLLLARGADPNGSSRHRPLHAAIITRNETVFQMLIDAGADVRSRNQIGRSCLHVLSSMVSPRGTPWKTSSVAEALCTAGAEMNATDASHKTALAIAAELGRFGLVRLLAGRGADLCIYGHKSVVCYLQLRMAEDHAASGSKGFDTDV